MGTTLDTNGKIFGVVASVHILLVCIFSLLTTGKCLPLCPLSLDFTVRLSVIVRIIFWSKKRTETGKIIKTIREGQGSQSLKDGASAVTSHLRFGFLRLS